MEFHKLDTTAAQEHMVGQHYGLNSSVRQSTTPSSLARTGPFKIPRSRELGRRLNTRAGPWPPGNTPTMGVDSEVFSALGIGAVREQGAWTPLFMWHAAIQLAVLAVLIGSCFSSAHWKSIRVYLARVMLITKRHSLRITLVHQGTKGKSPAQATCAKLGRKFARDAAVKPHNA
jgi:hypothetical protein